MLTFDDCVALSDAEAPDAELHALDTHTAFRVMAGQPAPEQPRRPTAPSPDRAA
ncbi:hypothetical protein [Azospirillum doebereinerae]|uniref:hypothetical protein n=1 Tax=Azospirillum doebereinerae TaxID=92933 RepID=UPI00163C2B9C|nr:hypothetical protein [Azospirillum doebereinerae]MCG5241837.1 hypothetical protein [Azospirillum doebereinerae]